MSSININHAELKQMLSQIYTKKIPLHLTGTTGIGKSASVFEFATETAKQEDRIFIDWNRVPKDMKNKVIKNPKEYFVFMDIRLSQFDSTDLKGLPKLGGVDCVEWLVQNWIFCLTNPDTKGVVFFDEMNLAPPSVQATAYQFIRDRCMGDVKLSDGVMILSAGNTTEDKGNVFDMAKPLQNRFIHATLLPPTVEDWTTYALNRDVDQRIIAFLQFKPNLLFDFQPDSPDMAFATHRSWTEFASPLIKDMEHDAPMFQKYVASAVGEGIALQFCAFTRLKDKIDFQKILDNPKLITDIKQIDLQYSLISIINEWFTKNYKKEHCDKLVEMLQYMQVEFAILTIRSAVAKHQEAVAKYFHSNPLWKSKLGGEFNKYIF
jgi:hypothetical protein